jgi:hypothetical protein
MFVAGGKPKRHRVLVEQVKEVILCLDDRTGRLKGGGNG